MSQYVSTDEIITFTSQEEFEDAVMKVVLSRLRVDDYQANETGGGCSRYLHLEDDK